MTDSAMAWLVVALVVFWSVGAHNRLIRLRGQAIAAFQALGEPLGRYIALVDEYALSATAGLAPAQQPVPPDGAAQACARLQAASTQFDASLRVARRQVLNAGGMAALKTALAVLQAAWARAQGSGPAWQHPLAAAYQLQWAENDQLAAHAMAAFNRAVSDHNAAIAQFPALLLAHLFGFRAAGCL